MYSVERAIAFQNIASSRLKINCSYCLTFIYKAFSKYAYNSCYNVRKSTYYGAVRNYIQLLKKCVEYNVAIVQQNTFFSLEQVIDRQPLTVSPTTPLHEVIGLMHEWGNSCIIAKDATLQDDTVYRNNSCVLVTENGRLQGIFTERDLVKLVAKKTDTRSVTVKEMMVSGVVTLTLKKDTDIFTALSFLREYRIRHLPIVDDLQNLIGLITAKNLRQKLQPINLMKWREASEVMNTELVYTSFDDSVRNVAILMAERDLSCVAICDLGKNTSQPDSQTNDSLVHPVGIITERDIVQYQNLGIDLEQPARNLMSAPLFLVSPQDSLWNVYQQMKQRRVRRLLVADEGGELKGIITQTSLLQIFDPSEMYGVIEVLQRQVCQLETEKERLLQKRNSELEQEIKEDAVVIETKERQLRYSRGKLQQAHQELSFHVNNSPLAVVQWDSNFCVQRWSKRAEQIFGWQESEVLGKHWSEWQFVLEADFEKLTESNNSLLDGTKPRNVSHNRNYTKDGSVIDCEWHNSVLLDEAGNLRSIFSLVQDVSDRQNALRDRQRREKILKDIASGVSVEVGENFFNSLVEFLSKTLQVNFAFVSKLIGSEVCSVKTLAVYGNGKNIDNFEYSLANAPCGDVIDRGLCLYPEAVRQIFPNIPPLEVMEAESYAGMPIFDAAGKVLGLIAVVDSKPFTDLALTEEVLKIFATRASTELERQQAELTLHQSEQKFRAIFDHTFQFIGLLEPDGKIIEANRTSLDFVGLTSEDVRGQLLWQTPWWSKSLEAQRLLKQGIERAAQGEFIRFEVEHPGTENRLVTADFSLTPIKDETGKVVMLIPEGRNISDRKQAEADLAKSNQILQAISSIQTQYLTDAEPRNLFDGMLAHLLELTQSEYGFIGEINFATDGSPTMEEGYMKVRGRPYLKTHAITNIAWNEETRAFYADNAPRGMEFHNLETLFGAVIVTGEPVIANSPSTDPRRGGIPEGHPPLNAFLGVPFYKNNKMTGMVGIANREGGYDEALVHYIRPFLDTCSRIIEAYRSERQAALRERRRQQAEVKIREQAALLDVATDAIMVRDLNDKILFWNRGAENLYGWTAKEALAGDVNEPLYRRSTARLAEIQQTVIERGEWQGELNHVTKAGSKIVVESRWTSVKDEAGNPHSYLVVNTDITEQKQLEAQFLRTQRLESLGTLAGGIAHDLNNILAPILGFSRLLPLKLPDADEQTKGFFKIIENNANRGSALVKQILTFSRGLEGERGVVQIRHLIAEIKQIISETFPKSIELDTNTSKNLWTVNADVNQLHQVLMNLAVNARDAMPNGGRLTINAENIVVERNYARLHLDATVGSYVVITATDTGVGIAPEIIDRIFEPFFTTKEVGRGTGLGLSTVIGIVKSHGGFVDVVSSKEPKDRGTQFKVFLPASDTTATEETEIAEIPQGNGELILVVDDETAILEVTKATLETYNYKVLTAENGIDAIATYVRRDAIELVIMDIMMPSMDGKTAIRTLKQIDPKLKILAVSGAIERQKIVAQLGDAVTAFMNKPYANDELLTTIRQIVSN